MKTTLSDVRAANRQWFSRGNKRMFGDVSYRILRGKISHKPYLVRSTYAWSDMFGEPKTLHYRVNELRDDLDIGPLADESFRDLDAVKDWLASR